MKKFIIRRIVQSIFLLFAIITLSFILTRLAPGGPLQLLAEDPRLSAATIRDIEERLGLREPLPTQYVKWLWGVVRLDFGVSFVSKRPVADIMFDAAINSFWLVIGGTFLGLFGIPIGIYAARHRGKLGDNLIRIFTVIFNSIPHWWLGLLIIIGIATIASNGGPKLLPLSGMVDIGNDTLLNRLWHMILPSFLIALTGLIVFSRFVRSQTLEVLGQDYVRTARAKGLEERIVTNRHVLRNSLVPLITIFGGILPSVFAGAAITENVLSWPGMGSVAVSAAGQRDYPVLMAVVLFFSFLTIAGNLLADIAYGLFDPRVRYD